MPDWESWSENRFCFLSRQEGFIREYQLIMNLAKASPSATAGFIPNPKARLLDQVREVMRFHHYSLRTEEAYLQWVRRFLEFCRNPLTPALSPGGGEGGENPLTRTQNAPSPRPTPPMGEGEQGGWRHPREMGAAEVAAFLSHLATERDVAAATQNQALNALVFLYGQVLGTPLGDLGEVARVTRAARLPTVLTAEETRRVLAALKPGTAGLIVRLLYGTGMRLLEGLRLRVKDAGI